MKRIGVTKMGKLTKTSLVPVKFGKDEWAELKHSIYFMGKLKAIKELLRI